MEDQPPRDLAKELREALANSPTIVLRIRNLGTSSEPYPELLVRERSTGKLLTITADKIEGR